MAITTTTSSVAMPSLLDLLAPTAAPASGENGRAAFDALLQPLPSGVSRENARQTRPHDDYRQEEESRSSPPPALPVKPPHPERPAQHSDFEPDDAVLLADDPTVLADEIPGDNTEEAESEIAAELHAGMVLCIVPVPLPAESSGDDAATTVRSIEQPQNLALHPESSDEDAATAEAIKPAAAKGGRRIRAVATAETVAVQPAITGEGHAVDATTAAVESDESVHQEVADNRGTFGEGVGDHPPIPTDDLQSIATTSESESVSAAEPTIVASVAAAGGADVDARDSQSPDAEVATAASERPTEQVLNAETVATKSGAPPIGPVVAPPAPVAEASASSNSSTAATGVGPTGPTRRPHLPTEMLSDAGRTARGSAPNIDATRLLGRVARAFAVAQQRDGEIQLRLSPPELGSLKLTIQMQEGGLVARLETETTSAKTALIDNLPALRERLAEQGVRIERFDVDLMQRQPGGMPDRPGDQQREAPPTPRAEARVTRTEESLAAPRGPLAKASSPSGLNVIV